MAQVPPAPHVVLPEPARPNAAQVAADTLAAQNNQYVPRTQAVQAFLDSIETPDDARALIPVYAMTMATDARALIFGVTPEVILREAYIELAESRARGTFSGLVSASLLAIGLGFTVAREWAAEYGQLPDHHMFKAFEIVNRTPTTAGGLVPRDGWVTNSNMNANAVRQWGHILVHWAPRGTFLATIKEKTGTMFEPPGDDDESERAELMRQASKEVTREMRALVNDAAEDFENLITLLNHIFGQPGASVAQMAAWARSYDEAVL